MHWSLGLCLAPLLAVANAAVAGGQAPLKMHVEDAFCPSKNKQNFTFSGKTYALHCEEEIYLMNVPDLKDKDLGACGEACGADPRCLGSFKDMDGYCQKIELTTGEGEAAWVPIPVDRTSTVSHVVTATQISTTTSVSTTTAVSTTTSVSTTTAVSTKISVSTLTQTSTTTSTERETRTQFFDATGKATKAPTATAPALPNCGNAREVWTVLGKRFAVYTSCNSVWQDADQYIYPGPHTTESCLEQLAHDKSGYAGAMLYPGNGNNDCLGLHKIINSTISALGRALIVQL